MRRVGSALAATALAATGIVGISGTAHASGTCDEPGTYWSGSTITEWTAPEYDGPGYWVRACINVNGYSACTPWH